jgi:acyl-CoA reductase-like NAD-dependent aldehyde dehydrogenase
VVVLALRRRHGSRVRVEVELLRTRTPLGAGGHGRGRGYSEGNVGTPFGGYKTSGFGKRDKGLEALEQYTELKTIWITLR